MRKFVVMAVICTVALGYLGCSKGASTPAEVLTRIKECKTPEDAKAFYTRGTLKALDELAKLMPEAQKDAQQGKSIGQTDKWDVVKEDINGDLATVTVKFTESAVPTKIGQTAQLKMKKEDGSWKLDMEDELNLGLKILKGFKGLNLDSLLKGIKK